MLRTNWKSLLGKEVVLGDGTVCYKRSDMFEMVCRLLGDVGDEAIGPKVRNLDPDDRATIEEALFQRFVVFCELCWKREEMFVTPSEVTLSCRVSGGKTINRDVAVCGNCLERLKKETGRGISVYDGGRETIVGVEVRLGMYVARG